MGQGLLSFCRAKHLEESRGHISVVGLELDEILGQCVVPHACSMHDPTCSVQLAAGSSLCNMHAGVCDHMRKHALLCACPCAVCTSECAISCATCMLCNMHVGVHNPV